MSSPMSADQIVDREYLEIRAKILEVAASFDRIGRGAGDVVQDPRMQRIHEALDALGQASDDRAEQIQLIFSLPYDDDWQEKFDIRPPS